MIKRTLYFGNNAYLHTQNEQLIVDFINNDKPSAHVPIEDIGMVILDAFQLTISQNLITKLLHNNVAIVSCNEKHMPQGMMLNLDCHSVQAERARYQVNASEPLKKALWQQTIYHKVNNQSALLKMTEGAYKKLDMLLLQIKSGDSSNVEGRAASIYWSELFGDLNFVRHSSESPPNALLNYGYAILRALTARALVGSGLFPLFGIFHHNRYNPYPLADDIMEPYRPFVDAIVWDMVQKGDFTEDILEIQHKKRLLEIATVDVLIDKRSSPLMVALSRTTSSLYECIEGSRRKIVYPALIC